MTEPGKARYGVVADALLMQPPMVRSMEESYWG